MSRPNVFAFYEIVLTGAGVKFLIGQIGSSDEAVAFLDTLRNNDAIKQVSHIFAGRFDDKFQSFRDERALDRWVRLVFVAGEW